MPLPVRNTSSVHLLTISTGNDLPRSEVYRNSLEKYRTGSEPQVAKAGPFATAGKIALIGAAAPTVRWPCDGEGYSGKQDQSIVVFM